MLSGLRAAAIHLVRSGQRSIDFLSSLMISNDIIRIETGLTLRWGFFKISGFALSLTRLDGATYNLT